MINVRAPTAEELQELTRMAERPSTRTAPRAQMVLLSAQAWRPGAIASLCGVKRRTVLKWLGRFHVDGPAGLCDRPRSGWSHEP